MNPKEVQQFIQEKLKVSLGDFIGQPIYGQSLKNIKNEVELSTKKLLASMSADLHGFKITHCDTMWNNFSLVQKCKWLFFNKVSKRARIERDAIDTANKALAVKARKEYEALPEDEQDFDWWELMDRIKYPWWAEPSPKTILETQVSIKPTQSMEFVVLSCQLEDLQKESDK